MPASLGFTTDEEAMLSRVLTTATHHARPASDLIKAIFFAELIRRLKGVTEEDRPAARCLLRTLVAGLVRIIIQFPQHRIRESPAAQRIRIFLNALFQDIERPWTLDEMSAACCVKSTQFAKITRQLTGYPPLRYLSRIRFQRAC